MNPDANPDRNLQKEVIAGLTEIFERSRSEWLTYNDVDALLVRVDDLPSLDTYPKPGALGLFVKPGRMYKDTKNNWEKTYSKVLNGPLPGEHINYLEASNVLKNNRLYTKRAYRSNRFAGAIVQYLHEHLVNGEFVVEYDAAADHGDNVEDQVVVQEDEVVLEVDAGAGEQQNAVVEVVAEIVEDNAAFVEDDAAFAEQAAAPNLQNLEHPILAPIFQASENRFLTADELCSVFLHRHELPLVEEVDKPLALTSGLFYLNSSRYVDNNVWDEIDDEPNHRFCWSARLRGPPIHINTTIAVATVGHNLLFHKRVYRRRDLFGHHALVHYGFSEDPLFLEGGDEGDEEGGDEGDAVGGDEGDAVGGEGGGEGDAVGGEGGDEEGGGAVGGD